MFVDLLRANRSSLTDTEKEFLTRAVDLSVFIQYQTITKARWFRNIQRPVGLKSSVIVADIIHESEWGSHPLSRPRYENKSANNLALLTTWKHYHGPSIKYRGKQYRAYKDTNNFAIDYSDWVGISGLFDNVLTTSLVEQQIEEFAKVTGRRGSYCARMKDIIETLKLEEFDSWHVRKAQLPM